MAEYLTPGVYIEETSFRSRSIEGVPTSTFGMAGATRYGPVPYVLTLPDSSELALVPKPYLVTNFTEFERAFGGLGDAGSGNGAGENTRNYLAYAARAFFANGGQRLYVARVFQFSGPQGAPALADFASLPVGGGTPIAVWRARWPGIAGSELQVQVEWQRSKNILVGTTLNGVAPGAAVEVVAGGTKPPDGQLPVEATIRIVARSNGQWGYAGPNGFEPVTAGTAVFHLTLNVTVKNDDGRVDAYNGLEVGDSHPRSITKVLHPVHPTDDLAQIWLDTAVKTPPTPAKLFLGLIGTAAPVPFQFLAGGTDGAVTAALLEGNAADPDSATAVATGIFALDEVDDIAIVATPDSVRLDAASQQTAVQNLITHCEHQKYRVAVIDPPPDSSMSGVRDFRAQFDSSYAALYYPWLKVVDPTASPDPSAPTPIIDLPPSGSVAGIYARSDIERGVFKAPANEVISGISGFAANVTFERQAVLNPEGVNALRFFEGRSNRVWGARTMSSDPEWKYVNVRRLFAYLEHSIDKATQWAVFEPNNESLWANIRQSIEDFLLVTWKSGALMGTKPEQAYFVRCDRTTMTQNDLDNGRLICLIGVAPTYPAEFVIFRIGQFTADAQTS